MVKRIFFKTFIFTAVLLIAACGKDEALTPNANFTGNSGDTSSGNTTGGGQGSFNENTDYYFSGDIDGVSNTFVQGKSNYINGLFYSEQVDAANNFETKSTITSTLVELEDDNNWTNLFPSFAVSYFVLFNSPPPSPKPYIPKLAVGNLPFGNEVTDVEGAIVSYTEAGNVVWSSDKGSRNQSGSTFEITNFQIITDPVGDSTMIITSKFDCTLYNDNGDSLKVVNGKFRGEYFGSNF